MYIPKVLVQGLVQGVPEEYAFRTWYQYTRLCLSAFQSHSCSSTPLWAQRPKVDHSLIHNTLDGLQGARVPLGNGSGLHPMCIPPRTDTISLHSMRQ